MILADHCVFGSTIRHLQAAGFQVRRSLEFIRPDATDEQVLACAIEHDLILLTNDRGFSNITFYPPGQHAGLIILRISAQSQTDVHNTLIELLHNHDREDLRHKLAVVSQRKYRLRA
ncbi:MAG: PIN domain nuclease [Armatimonadetes bacterium]|nr:PIN domain nuclease [Armatimonadota bacterium]